jgi:hypothetical protein
MMFLNALDCIWIISTVSFVEFFRLVAEMAKSGLGRKLLGHMTPPSMVT